jgi:hypothetical protein
MKKAITLALVGLAISTWGLDARAVGVTTLGDRSCGKWIADRPSNPSDQSIGRLSNTGWLVGFMSGAASASGRDILERTDGQSIVLWMDNWCRANPLEYVADGAMVLFVELEKQIKPTGGR